MPAALSAAWLPAFAVTPWREATPSERPPTADRHLVVIIGADGWEVATIQDRPDERAVVAAICALPTLLAAMRGAIEDLNVAIDPAAAGANALAATKTAREFLRRALILAAGGDPQAEEG